MINKIVDIGTKKLEYSVHGSGEPIVVIETGMGCAWYDWWNIINELSKITTVLTYHRAGYGRSTIGQEERTTKNITEDLNKLLDKEKIDSPIILVGHSFGGLCVQHFANLFPQKVKGMVLVDSNSVEEFKMDQLRKQLPSFNKIFPKNGIIEKWKELSLKNEEQLEILLSPKLLPHQELFIEEIQKCILQFQVNPNMYLTIASELSLMAQSGQDIKKSYTKLDIPLKVLGRDKDLGIEWNINVGISKDEAIEFENLWHQLVKEEAKLSSQGDFIEVKGSSHSIYRTNPEVVMEAINYVIRECKQ